MKRQIVTATLLTARCSSPGVAGAEVSADADPDIALLLEGSTTTESSLFSSSLPPGTFSEAVIWENSCGGSSAVRSRLCGYGTGPS